MQPAQRKKSSKILFGIGGGLLAVAVLILVAVNVIGGDSLKVLKAIEKSGKAYATAIEKMELPDLSKLTEKKAFTQNASLWIEDAPLMMSSLDGLGVRVIADTNLPERTMGASIVPYYGSVEMLHANANVVDNAVYLSMPELLGSTSYMIDTATLGESITRLDDSGMFTDLSFNLFDLIEQIGNIEYLDEEVKKQLAKTITEQFKTITVEKTGKENIEVNDHMVKSTAYHVVIPETTLENLLQAAEDVYDDADIIDKYIDIIKSIGLPEELAYELDMADQGSEEIFDWIDSVLDVLGDIELDMYLSDGYVVAVEYEEEIGTTGNELEISLQLGGGKNYVDDLSLEYGEGLYGFAYKSSGNHGGKDGIFTDETTVDVFDGGAEERMLDTEFSYEPKVAEDNFEFQAKIDTVTVKIAGNLSSEEKGMMFRCDEVSFYDGIGVQYVSLGLEYQIGEYMGDLISEVDTEDSVELLEMSESELQAAALGILGNAYAWSVEMESLVPDLIDFFDYF